MLRQRPVEHKRKNSQIDLFYPQNNSYPINTQPKLSNISNKHTDNKQINSKSKSKKLSNDKNDQNNKYEQNKNSRSKNQLSNKNDKKLRLSLQQKKNKQNIKNIIKLVQNSQKKVNNKQTVIQDINQNNQNIDYSNGANYQFGQDEEGQINDQNYQTFFQFGRKYKYSTIKKQFPDNNYGYLNMEQITEVPDTMSNQRRYQNSNYYQFHTSNQNSLINFSNKLIQDQIHEDKQPDTLQSKQVKDTIINFKTLQQPKNLKKRKQKLPKNVLIQGQQLQQKFDLSQLTKGNKKSKIFFINKKQNKSKSKQNLKNIEKQKSKSTLFLNKKLKNLSQTTLAVKKKSFSLKNQNKNQLKLSQKKPKSFEKQKDLSQTKSSQQFLNRPTCKSAKSSERPLNFQKPKNLQIGQKIMMIQQSQSKLQNQYKILWQCMGQLWQNSRITRYISQKNKSDIMKLKEGQKQQDQKMIKLKSQILNSISSARY